MLVLLASLELSFLLNSKFSKAYNQELSSVIFFFLQKPPEVRLVCTGGPGGEGFGESDEHYAELIKRVEFNARDHRTRYVTAALILACTYANKPLLADICVACLSEISKDVNKKGVLELYANHEIAFHLVSFWFLTIYYDEKKSFEYVKNQ